MGADRSTVDAADGARNLQSLVLRGLGWKFLSGGVLQAWQIVAAVVLARLLRPHDYGLAGMVLVLTTVVIAFSDLAMGAALIQRRKLTEKDRSTVFWTGVAAGLAFTLVGLGLSGPVARFYGQPDVRDLFAAFSLSFFITSLGTTQKALLTREMNFRSLELRQIAGSVGGGIVGITVAAQGYGAWAIIGQQLTMGVLSTVLLWMVTPWRPHFTYSFESLRNLGGFSANVLGQRLLYQLTRSADNVLIGRFLGPAAVGTYAVAYNVMLLPLSRLGTPIGLVLFPALSRMQDDPERVTTVWLRVNRLLAAVSVPAMLGLIVVAHDFVHVVLGARWAAATPVLQILAWVGVLQAIQTLNEDVLQVRDRTGTMFRFMVLWSSANLLGLVIGLHWGIIGVAVGVSVAGTVVAPVSIWLTARVAGVSMRAFAANLAGVFQAALGMAAVVFAARLLLVSAGVPTVARLLILVLIGIASYLALTAWRMPDVIADVRRLRTRTPAPAPAPVQAA
jgi:O-antigen/teichoic acid export membrane protein